MYKTIINPEIKPVTSKPITFYTYINVYLYIFTITKIKIEY